VCVLCYELADEGHWSDAVHMTDESPEPPARARYRRAKLLTDILRSAGLAVRVPGPGRGVVVANNRGGSLVAAGLPQVWDVADRLGTRLIDPLDPQFLDRLAGQRASTAERS
jgi:hypothetical protein